MRLFAKDQIASAQKANARALFDSMGKRLDGIEKFGQLNLEVSRRVLSEQVQSLNAGAATDGMRGLLAQQSEIFAQFPKQLASYHQRFREIVSATQSELTAESQRRLEAHRERVRTLFGRISDDAPAAFGEAALLPSTTGEMPSYFEDAETVTKQAIEAVDTDGDAVDGATSGPAAPNLVDENGLRKP
jgi:phasin family protein